MRRIVFILSIIILTGLAAYYLIFRDNSTMNPFASDFSLGNPDKVTEITIADREGKNSLVLTTEGWKMNEVIVFQEKVEDLLMLMHLIEISSPAPIEFANDINACLDEGIKITFHQDKKVLKSFSLCKFNRSLYARKPNIRKAYRISIRGYGHTDLTAIVTSKLMDWQQNIFIDLAATDIRKVSIHYPGTNKKGFKLNVESTGNPYLFDEEGRQIKQTIEYQRAKDYIHFFSGIRYYDAKKEFPEKTFNKNDSPFCDLKIETWSSVVISIKGYRISDPETGKLNSAVFYAIHPEFGLIILKYSDFDPILVERDYFLKN